MKDREEVRSLLEGNHRRKSVILGTVSGVATTKTALVEYVDRELPAIGLITTKSFQVIPNSGNREPVITEPSIGCFGNSVGLRNPGMKAALRELQGLRERKTLRALLNISVSASTPEDFIILVKAFGPLADCIELNFSCPHAAAGYGASIGCDIHLAAAYMRAIREAVGNDFSTLIIPKLTPNVDAIGDIAKALIDAGADGISAINTVGPEQYLEPHCGASILNNSLDGRGGMSGTWIKERALVSIAEIRNAVGDQIPIIGMGGVSTGADAAAMILAGADTVGLGSVFGRVHQRDWQAFTNALVEDTVSHLNRISFPDSSSGYLRTHTQMDYTPYTITRIVEHSSDVKIFYTDGSLACRPGQFAFIWLPGVGEKPFSVTEGDPLTFIIKERGPFTHAMMKCVEGDVIYVRGVYGEGVETADTKKAVILAGGTGAAVVPSLAKQLKQAGVDITIYYGVSGTADVPLLQDELSAYGTYTAVADDGKPGRVIEVMAENIHHVEDTAFYTIGPEVFMSKAAAVMAEKGIPDDHIFLSMERLSLCGIGMCGECACGNRLTCQYGTFMQLDFLKEHSPELL